MCDGIAAAYPDGHVEYPLQVFDGHLIAGPSTTFN
jgi:hypothetical protein